MCKTNGSSNIAFEIVVKPMVSATFIFGNVVKPMVLATLFWDIAKTQGFTTFTKTMLLKPLVSATLFWERSVKYLSNLFFC